MVCRPCLFFRGLLLCAARALAALLAVAGAAAEGVVNAARRPLAAAVFAAAVTLIRFAALDAVEIHLAADFGLAVAPLVQWHTGPPVHGRSPYQQRHEEPHQHADDVHASCGVQYARFDLAPVAAAAAATNGISIDAIVVGAATPTYITSNATYISMRTQYTIST